VKQNNVEAIVSVQSLPWGEQCAESYDIILGSEVTYSGETWDALATTIVSGAKSTCRVILSEAYRYLEVSDN